MNNTKVDPSTISARQARDIINEFASQQIQKLGDHLENLDIQFQTDGSNDAWYSRRNSVTFALKDGSRAELVITTPTPKVDTAEE